jgi:hypothetical protein
MPRSRKSSRSDPFSMWSTLALRQGEMLVAAQQVIAHRTARMMVAGPAPGARDRREFALMHREKGEAAMLSVFGMWAELGQFNQRLVMEGIRNASAGWQALFGLATKGGQGSLLTHNASMMGAATRSATLGSELAGSLLHSALDPIHARATANARRLGKLR